MALRRGVALVLSLIGLAVVVSITALAVTYLIVTQAPAVERDSTLVLRVRGGLAEVEPTGVIGQLLAGPPTVRSVIDNLRKAKADPRVRRVVLKPSGTQALWGKVQEIREAVLDFKQSGKPIVAYLEWGGAQEYFLATACDRIYLMPTSALDLTGVATYELFLKGTLDLIGAEPDLLHIGEYKTTRNTFTEKAFTPAHREMAESLNRDLYDQLLRAVADGRRMNEADVRSLVDEGPFLPEVALRRGLVDELAYEDELEEGADGARRRRIVDDDDYRAVSLRSVGLNTGPRIAVIYAVGVIASGESESDGPQGRVLGSETIVESIREARADRSIRAIVLRIDSTGGSAIASDVIWRELQITRAAKPIVASMSDVAASGGYYIAMPAYVIVAQPATLTGSIGIVMGKFALGGTFGKLGMTVESVSDGRFAEINSPVRRYNPDERARVEAQMRAIYDQFIEKAAQARQTTPERIDQVAQGRVWTGRQAKAVGLVDELGGLGRAIQIAKERATIDAEAEVEIVIYPRPRSLYELVSRRFGRGGAAALAALAGSPEARVLESFAAPWRRFRRGEPLAIMPNVFLR